MAGSVGGEAWKLRVFRLGMALVPITLERIPVKDIPETAKV